MIYLALFLGLMLGVLLVHNMRLWANKLALVSVLAVSSVSIGGLYWTVGTPSEAVGVKRQIARFDSALRTDPQDIAAHMAKARSYMQLKDFGQAQAAYLAALDVAPRAQMIYREYVGAMQFAGIEVEPRSPSQAFMEMDSDDQRNAIQAMVESLAARLYTQGGTAEEWDMLARSHEVLGNSIEAEKARLSQPPKD